MQKNVLLELKSEKVLTNLKDSVRTDGRKLDEYRKISIEKGIYQNAEGSAKVTLGDTEVIAGVKLLPGKPYPDSPNEGTISVGTELIPLASPFFESGPPSTDSIELSRVVDRGIRESKAVDFKKLCITEGELVFIGFVDIYAINFDGNLFDASAIAAIAALDQAKIPKIEDEKTVKDEFSGKLKLERKPILSTFAKIGNFLVLDPDLLEETAMQARFSVATTEDNFVSAFQKGLPGSIKKEDVDSAIDTAFKAAKEIRKML
ncbi:exosome complex protein Rrp42 [Candidatus Micrarchaeota archaeon]|nr:exosome complex protein Rrp42 [Candidatus Micrarchaeota archaeon]MBU2475984.1 exosome complex protein Rrp42 [Candidatus Micrarchaeota archaeon]